MTAVALVSILIWVLILGFMLSVLRKVFSVVTSSAAQTTGTVPLANVQKTGRIVAAFLANPLGIPREQSPEQLESTLKLLASDEGFARAQRFLFFGCMCLVAGLGSAMIAALGVRTHVLGPALSAIALVVAYSFLRQTQWLVWIGSKLRETSVFRAHFFPSVLKQTADTSLPEKTGDQPSNRSEVLGLDRMQIFQLVAWLALWIACVVVLTKGAPQTQRPPIQILALLGLASYFSVRVGTVLVQLLRITGAVFGGTLVGAAIVFFETFWMAQGGGGADMFALFVATIGLGAVWSLSLIEYNAFNMCYITLPRGGQGQYHFQTPDLSAFSKFLNPILFTIHAPSSTVIVLRRDGDGKYWFHDSKLPISPIHHVYDIFDLTETQAVTYNFDLTQDGKTAKALKAASVPIKYGCYPRTPSPEEMKQVLDGRAVERFSEVFFHGMGLEETVSPWLSRAAQDWFSSDPLYQSLVDIQTHAKELADIANTLQYDPNSKNLRLEDLSLEDLSGEDDGKLLRHGAKTSIQLARGDMAKAEKLIAVVRNEIKGLRQKLKDFPFKDALPALQRQFEETMAEQFKDYDNSYKLLVSMLSLRITLFDLAEPGDLEQEFRETEAALQKRFETARAEFRETLAGEEIKERTMTEQEKEKFEFVKSHLPGDMTVEEVQTTLNAFDPTAKSPPLKQATPKPVVAPTLIIEDAGSLDPNVTKIDVRLKLGTVDAMWKAFAEKPGARIRFSTPGFEVVIIFTRDETVPEEFSIPLRLNRDTTKQPVVTEIKVGVRLAMIEKIRRMFEENPTEAVVFSNPKSEVAIVFTRDETIPGAFSIPERIYPPDQPPSVERTDDELGPT
jgi:hypothetical protein